MKVRKRTVFELGIEQMNFAKINWFSKNCLSYLCELFREDIQVNNLF